MAGGSLQLREYPNSLVRLSGECGRSYADLTKLDRHSLGVLASPALESPHVVIWLVARLDAHKQHRQVARRTASLSDRALGRVKTVWLRHDARLLNFPALNPRYVYEGDRSRCQSALRKGKCSLECMPVIVAKVR